MKQFEHLNFELRKIINNKITEKQGVTCKDIAELIGVDPTTISKEVKRNRYLSKKAPSNVKDYVCKKTLRFPYVCNSCPIRCSCKYNQYRYEASFAQKNADYNLVASRSGIDLTKEEFDILDKKIKDGIAQKDSIYNIVHSNDDIKVSVPTVYKYISLGILSTKRINLPYAVTYKKRKKSNKKYEYFENKKIDRSNHTYIDYLSYVSNNPNVFHAEMDFLGSIKTDSKSILTLTIPKLHFVRLFLVENKNSSKVIDIFNHLEDVLSPKIFKKIFGCILTDRDPCFSDFDSIEFNPITGEFRCHIYSFTILFSCLSFYL